MNNLFLQIGGKNIPLVFSRCYSSSNTCKKHSCKVLVLGGGSGGCTMAAKLAKHSKLKDSVIILDANQDHYYQPLFTLVGAGVKRVAQTRRSMKSVLPTGVKWIQDYADCIDPGRNVVRTEDGHTIEYEYLIVSVGVDNNYEKIPGLYEALKEDKSSVSSIFAAEFCEKTYGDLQKFKSGNAIFTFPDSQIKCPGAPQKIAYLADSYFTKTGKRNDANIMFNTCLPVIFGVPKYAKSLLKVVERKKIVVNYRTVLQYLDAASKTATFMNNADNCQFTVRYEMLHVTPPMHTPKFLRTNTELVDEHGFLDVDKFTLQHTKFKNIFGIGDCTNTPNSKTAAAIAKQSYVLEHNLMNVFKDKPPSFSYNGYGACPLVTSYNTCILAEFLYGGVVHETMPFDQETRIAYYMKRDLFPFIYWNLMLKGYYNGPEFIRNIINPFASKNV